MTTEMAPVTAAHEHIAGLPREQAAALAADALALVAELSDEISQLKFALDSNRRIGMAMGLVMGQLKIADDEALDALRRISQNTNRKLRDVADDIILNRRL